MLSTVAWLPLKPVPRITPGGLFEAREVHRMRGALFSNENGGVLTHPSWLHLGTIPHLNEPIQISFANEEFNGHGLTSKTEGGDGKVVMEMKCVAKCHAIAIPPAHSEWVSGGKQGLGGPHPQLGLPAGPVGQHPGQGTASLCFAQAWNALSVTLAPC